LCDEKKSIRPSVLAEEMPGIGGKPVNLPDQEARIKRQFFSGMTSNSV
jgi:hypothetical protein